VPQHEEEVGRIVPRSSVDTNVVGDKGDDNRMEDVEMSSPVQSSCPVPVPSKHHVRVVNCGLLSLMIFFP
jgi:hypothetical protein